MAKYWLFLLFFKGLLTYSCLGQNTLQTIGLTLPEGQNSVTFPFENINHLIVIPITINNNITLKFILDTGANSPILTERLFGDIIGLTYDRNMYISGPGIIDTVGAYVANRVLISLPNGLDGSNMSLLVLEEDYIELKKNMGADIYGIIGYDVFSRFVVDIDYRNLQVKFIDPYKFKVPRRYKAVEMTIENSKPFIQAVIGQENNRDTLKLMVDTGASHALLLDVTENPKLHLPEETLEAALGHGLGGIIPGRIGRIDKVTLENFELKNVLASFPDAGMYSNSIKRGSRDGTIGSNLLSHFNVIINYKDQKLYLKKNNRFRKPFKYDMSGMSLGYFESPKRIEVTSTIPGSPADLAGIQRGDVIYSLDNNSLENMSLPQMTDLLRTKQGKNIVVKYKRDGKLYKKKLELKVLI